MSNEIINEAFIKYKANPNLDTHAIPYHVMGLQEKYLKEHMRNEPEVDSDVSDDKLKDFMTYQIKTGSQIYCEGQRHAYKLEEELKKQNIETRIGCDESGIWSVYIVKIPDKLFQFESSQMMDKLKNYIPRDIDDLNLV